MTSGYGYVNTTQGYNVGAWTVGSGAGTGNIDWASNTSVASNWIPITGSSGMQLTPVTPVNWPMSLTVLKEVATEGREWVEALIKDSPNFADLQGTCALVSRKIFKDLKKRKVAARLIYHNDSSYQHVFIRVLGAASEENVGFEEDHIIDVTASLFGEEDVCVLAVSKCDPIKHPWWSPDQEYSSESGLLARQKKDRWPTSQITFKAAKEKKSKLEFVMVGHTDVERGLIRIEPFDVGAVKYFKQQKRGRGLRSNLASLILDPDDKVSKPALTIAMELINR